MDNLILNTNFFDLFQLPITYQIDLKLLQKNYIGLQQHVHPDKFVNASAQEKRLSMQQTSWLNQALSTLKNPVLRAIYLLELKGVDFSLENKTTNDSTFLMQQLSLREHLETIKNKPENALGALEKLATEIKQSNEQLMNDFSIFHHENKLDQAAEVIKKLQFMQKLKTEINTAIATIEDQLLA